MTPENFRFYDNFEMQDNTYTDESDFHFTFLAGECEYNGKIENVWVDVSGWISKSGSIITYFDDDFNGYIFDESRNAILVTLPDEVLIKLSKLAKQAIEKSRDDFQAKYGE